MKFSSESYSEFKYNYKNIPTEWMLETYLDLPYKLVGQSIKIRSVFNHKDNDPSLIIYYNSAYKCYRFNDFSAGKKGSIIDLLMGIWNVSFPEASKKLINDYYFDNKNDSFKLDKNKETYIVVPNKTQWKIENVTIRNWTTKDAKYWSSYNINSILLNKYNIKPIKNISIGKIDTELNVFLEGFEISNQNYIYGFFKNDGTLYKLYRPFSKKNKFFIFNPSYTQGIEQLEGHDSLIITASLKDGLALKSLNLNVDIIAPNSETSMLSADFELDILEETGYEYEYIITIFDDDGAGKMAMQKYLEKRKIPFAYLPYGKDIAVIVKSRGYKEAVNLIVPLMDNAFIKYKSINKKQ